MSGRSAASAGRFDVASAPTPMLICPPPNGKIQPYPGSTSPSGERSSRCEVIHSSSPRADLMYARPATAYTVSLCHSRPRIFPSVERTPSATMTALHAISPGPLSSSTRTEVIRPAESRSTSTALVDSAILAPESTAT
ncbi:Uncharacterised protein [Mycobacteroides abscessus subsp. abscessus]|nr:Uncharacterised protein [Mycobacteroides abscessus subsp. abscessus]